MLTTDEFFNIEDYAFKSSPESCSSNSCFTDCTDLPSDEDFLQQLSSDLDIPLLLNAGEDELNLLNSFFDKTPEEIMSDIILPPSPEGNEIKNIFPELSDIKVESSDTSSSYSSKSSSPVQYSKALFHIKEEVKIEPDLNPNVVITGIERNVGFMPTKRIAIQPKTATNNNKVLLLKNLDCKRKTVSPIPPPSKVVVLENIATVPITTVAQQINSFNNTVVSSSIASSKLGISVGNIDPKLFKRQQRKIKNRESACLSRKKKKDYLTSLENQVKELSDENRQLRVENRQLKEQLKKSDGNQPQNGSSHAKTSIVLCMFLFSVAFNFDYIRNPLISKNQAIEPSTPRKSLDHHGRSLLWTEDVVEKNNTFNFLPLTMCPALINQTESARLALELERWIGKPVETAKTQPTNNITKLTVRTPKQKSLRRRKLKKYTTFVSVYDNRKMDPKLSDESGNNEIQVFSPTPQQLYSEFFEAINRQDDTFYVVSFSDHHMLLPALHHNKTRRPKMSLIMPSVLPNSNISQASLIPLMQIDCEVLDTRLIQVKSGAIPRHLRRNGNSTVSSNDSVSKSTETSTNYTNRKAYKPYFIRKTDMNNLEGEQFNRH